MFRRVRHRVRHVVPLSTAVGVILLLGACESTPSEPGVTPNPVTGVSVSAPTTTVPVGTTVQLSATVAPATVSQGVVWSTSDATRASVSASGLVTAITPGVVRITATSTLDGSKSGGVDLTLTGCLALTQDNVANGGTLAQDTCYEVVFPLTVNSGTLVVQPGVRIEFRPTGSLTIGTAGRLNASGTAIRPILFTSKDPIGDWRGVRFDNSRSIDNILRFVTIENAGSAGWSGAAQSRAGVLLDGASRVDIQNSTLASNGGSGIAVYRNSEMVFENNTLRENDIAAWVHPTTAQYVGSSTTFTANTANVVRTTFGNTDAVETAQTWHRLAVPFEIQTRVFVDALLTLEPGVTLSSLDNVAIVVRNGGAITALGTAALPITFTSATNAPASWNGLQITTASLDNRFDHVTFENGGNFDWAGGGSRSTVYMNPSSKAVFTNSTFRGSGLYALTVPGTGDITGFDGNTFTQNARTIRVHPEQAGAISANNSFTQNTENAVRMTFFNTDAVQTAQTWRDFGVPFYVQVRTLIQAAVTIDPGVEFEFAQGASFVVNAAGSLRANGTVQNPVAFRGREDLTGFWQGIQFSTASPQNVLTNVSFRNAGSNAWFGGNNSTSTLWVDSDATLNLSNVTFALTGGFAGIVSFRGSLSCSNVTLNGFMYYVTTNSGSGATGTCPG